MDDDRGMYRWRRMTEVERAAELEERRRRNLPWHWPAHRTGHDSRYLVTAACYEHRPWIGSSAVRMAAFEGELLQAALSHCEAVYAWTVLPNHYHVLALAPDLDGLLHALGRLHGRTSYQWNGEDSARGRHVWHGAAETAMKSEGHFQASVNYVLHNAVRHGYVERWQDWPYCNARDYLEEVGREAAERRWRKYPVLEYGKDWDPAEL